MNGQMIEVNNIELVLAHAQKYWKKSEKDIKADVDNDFSDIIWVKILFAFSSDTRATLFIYRALQIK